MKSVIKKRPRRLFYDDKKKKYFYLINRKKRYINISKGISQKQISKINIKNIIGIPVTKKRIRPRGSYKPILKTQIVSKLVPIAPIAENLSKQSKNLFTGKEEFEKRLDKLEAGFKPVNVKEKEDLIKRLEKLEKVLEKGLDIKLKLPYDKITNSVIQEAIKKMKEKKMNREIEEQKKKYLELLKELKDKIKIPKPTIFGQVDIELIDEKDKEEKERIDKEIEKDLNRLKEEKEKEEKIKEIFKSKKTQWKYDEFKDVIINSFDVNKLKNINDADYEDFRKSFNDNNLDTKKLNISKNKFSEFLNNIIKELNEEVKGEEEVKEGMGAFSNDDDGMYNTELQEIFKDKTNKFLPVISSDRMNTLIPMVNKNTKKFGWIQNTEPSTSSGRHWIAWFIDIPNFEINFYDSLVENGGMPTKQSLKGLKKIIDKINPEYYLLLKYNTIREQNPNSKNCGYFALKFIMDRYRNISFKEATGYEIVNNFGEGEYKIEKFKDYL